MAFTSRAVHRCLGCGVPDVHITRISCMRCWGRLPEDLQTRVIAAWRNRNDVTPAQQATIREAQALLRQMKVGAL